MTTVANVRSYPNRWSLPPGHVYIGRPSKWGNPYQIGVDGSRADVIEAYRKYLHRNLSLVEAARTELKGKTLVCWCAPEPCHGDVLAALAEEEK